MTLLGLDVESTYMDDRGQFSPDFRVRTVQLATKDEPRIYDLCLAAQREEVAGILSDPAFTFCSHTNMDVLSVWVEFGIDISGRNIDTHALAIMANPDKYADRDLKTLASDYGMPELKAADDELYEWMRSTWIANGGKKNAAKSAIEEDGWNRLASADPSNSWPEVFTRYAGLDALCCRRLVEKLIPETNAPIELLAKEQWLDTATNRMQMRGMRVDVERLDVELRNVRLATGAAKTGAERLTGGVNINGPKILDWLGEHGVDWDAWQGARTPKGRPSLAKENLALVGSFPLDDAAREVFEDMTKHSKHLDMLRRTEDISKRLTYAKRIWFDVDGIDHIDDLPRIHPNINPRGATTTARMSSSKPNVQNFSKKDARHRGLFLPDPGHELWTIDFAQVELRVVAALAREEKMIETIHAGGDLHQLTVDELAAAGVTISRQQAKSVNFLIVYGGGAAALHAQTGIPLDEAAEIIRKWRERYASITALSQYLAMRPDYIRTISNRRLPVGSTKAGDSRSYANINYAVQSAARELLVDAWHRFEVEFEHEGIVWLPIHDELVLQIPDGQAEKIIPDAERAMTFDFRGVQIEADAVKLLDENGVSRWMPGDLTHWTKEKAA